MAKGRVLVVDDDPDIRAFVEMALEDEGYDVATAVDGAAVSTAREQQPDVILLDLMMPGMDGVEVSRRLRDDPATAAIPIVVMSAHDRIRTLAGQMPVQDRLAKPFQIDQMYAAVARWMPAEKAICTRPVAHPITFSSSLLTIQPVFCYDRSSPMSRHVRDPAR